MMVVGYKKELVMKEFEKEDKVFTDKFKRVKVPDELKNKINRAYVRESDRRGVSQKISHPKTW